MVGPTGAQISDVLLAATYVSSAVAWIRRRRLPARDALLWGTVPFLAVAGLAGAFLFHGLFTGAEEFRHLWALAGLGAGAASLRPAEVSPDTRSAS